MTMSVSYVLSNMLLLMFCVPPYCKVLSSSELELVVFTLLSDLGHSRDSQSM